MPVNEAVQQALDLLQQNYDHYQVARSTADLKTQELAAAQQNLAEAQAAQATAQEQLAASKTALHEAIDQAFAA